MKEEIRQEAQVWGDLAKILHFQNLVQFVAWWYWVFVPPYVKSCLSIKWVNWVFYNFYSKLLSVTLWRLTFMKKLLQYYFLHKIQNKRVSNKFPSFPTKTLCENCLVKTLSAFKSFGLQRILKHRLEKSVRDCFLIEA